MAIHAEQVGLPAVPLAGPLAMNARLPVAVLLAMALAAKLVGFLELDRLAGSASQRVSVVRIVAVETPPMLFIVVQLDLVVRRLQLAPGPVEGRSLLWHSVQGKIPLEKGGGGTGYSPACLASTAGGAGGRVFPQPHRTEPESSTPPAPPPAGKASPSCTTVWYTFNL